MLKPIKLVIVLLLLSACTTRIYGVSEEVWSQLNDTQKQTTIQGYNEQKKLDKERRLVREKRKAEEAERQRIEAEIIADLTRRRVKDIYAGKSGVFGDLIRVSIHSGSMRFSGKHREIQPVSFKLADGEQKHIIFRSDNGRTQKVRVGYNDGTLRFGGGNNGKWAKRFAYEPSWRHGMKYTNVTLDKHSRSKAKTLTISVHIIRTF
ncbi:MAG: hypothetical protein HQL69_22440 [Magnetococcales bacterium]|nr:hypothetical protein [Magnetococcales bacterium]